MKRGGIYHPAVNHLLASTGHTDYFTVCDRGFPVPVGPVRIDLALTDDIPTVLDVVRAVMPEFQVDRVLIATEASTASPDRVQELRVLLDPIPLIAIDHLELKALAQAGRATIRTADTVPYANIIIVSG
ncbi:MAG TPA: D-ribose pyranase [Thermomicrobiales bacterium]|nr:D-ribose pyranase [Thermomicrobiales bacterium]